MLTFIIQTISYLPLIRNENILQSLRYIGFHCFTITVKVVNRPRTCQNPQWIIHSAHAKILSVFFFVFFFGSKILSIVQSADGENIIAVIG